MGDFLSIAISIAFHGLALAMVLYLISVGLSVTMGLMASSTSPMGPSRWRAATP